MITIRKGVFETNSSSSHSIIMSKTDKPASKRIEPDYHMDKNGIIDFWYESDLEFGRSPFDLLTTWYQRLCYAIAYFGMDKEHMDEIKEICRKRIIGFTGFKFEENRYNEDTKYHGYVDHQSYGVLEAALSKFNITLEEFIFNDRYIVVIDGDEYNVFYTLKQTEMFNENGIENIVGAYDIDNEEDE